MLQVELKAGRHFGPDLVFLQEWDEEAIRDEEATAKNAMQREIAVSPNL